MGGGGEHTKRKCMNAKSGAQPSLTLDGLGMLLDLTLSHSGCYIPNDDFPTGVGRSEAQGVR